MVEEVLLAQAARARGIEASDAELGAGQGRDAADLSGPLGAILRDELLAMKLREEILDEATVDLEEVRDYFDRHPEEFRSPARFRLRQIFTDDEARAREALRSLEKEVPFEAVAAGSDESPFRGAPQSVRAEDLPPELREEVQSLRPGGRSGIVASPDGFHIFLLVAEEPGRPLSWEEAREEAEEEVLRLEAARRIGDLVAEAKGSGAFRLQRESLDFPYTPPEAGEGSGERGGPARARRAGSRTSP